MEDQVFSSILFVHYSYRHKLSTVFGRPHSSLLKILFLLLQLLFRRWSEHASGCFEQQRGNKQYSYFYHTLSTLNAYAAIHCLFSISSFLPVHC